MYVSSSDKQRWVIQKVDPLTIEAVKALASSSGYSMGKVVDLAVEYFSKKVHFEHERPLKWSLPDDF